MTDMSQTNLTEPLQTDWDTAYSGSKYSAPPPAMGADGKSIQYQGVIVEAKEVAPDTNRDTGESFLQYQVDFKLVNAGPYSGQTTRTWVSTRPFMKRDENGDLKPMKGNPNKLGSMLRSAGLQAKPQTNDQYRAAVKAIGGTKSIPFTIDWKARNKDTNEQVVGFLSFPQDETGARKAILKKGDLYTVRDRSGAVVETKTVDSEVLFANAQVKYFLDPTPRVAR